MESAMRRRLGKRVWKAILWLLLFSLAGSSFFGILYQIFGSNKNNILQVNGIGITRNELTHETNMLQEMIHMIRSQAGEYADFILMQNGLLGQPQALAQDRLVTRAVALDAANKSGIVNISDAYATEKLDDPNFVLSRLSTILPSYLFQGYGRVNRAALDDFFRRSPEQAARFDAQYNAILKEDLFSRIIEGLAYIPAISQRWNETLAQSMRTFSIYTLSKSFFNAEANARLDDDILQNFFKQENSRRRYWSTEKRAGIAWKFLPEKYGINVSDISLRRYFADHNKTEFKDKTFDSVKKEIEKRLLKDQFKKLFSIEAKSYTAANTAEGFASFAKKKHGIASPINLVSSENATSQASRTLFSTVRVGARSFFVDEDGVGYIVELNEIEPSSEQTFESVKKQVRADWLEVETRRGLELAADELLKSLSDAKLRQSVAKKYKAAQKDLAPLVGESDKGWKKLEDEKLPVAQMKRMGHVGYGILASPREEAISVVCLSEFIKNSDSSEDTKVREKEDSNLLRIMKMVFEKDVLAVLKESAKIKQYKEEKAKDISY